MKRYWYSNKHKLNFAGIPKCGTTSVLKALDIDVDLDWTQQPENAYPSFTVLRHPVSRFFSIYGEMKRQNNHKGARNALQFAEFLRAHGFWNNHQQPQVDYFVKCNHVFCLELDFMDEIAKLTNKKIKYAHENRTKAIKRDLSDELLQIIESIYSDDFALYGRYYLPQKIKYKNTNGDRATAEDFNADFEKNMAFYDSYQDTYEYVESSHVDRYGSRRYKNYESFKIIRHKLLHKY